MAKAAPTYLPWLHSRRALVVKTIIGLGLAYLAFSRALNTGSYWEYLAGAIFLGLAIKFIVHLFKRDA